MMPPDERITTVEESVDFARLAAILRRDWWIIALFMAAALLAAITVLHLSTYRYTASMVVTPAQSSGSDGLSSRLGQLGGLASAVGVSLPDGGGASAFKLYVEGLKSYNAAQILAQDPAIMHRLFDTEWDPVARQWKQPQGGLRNFINGTKDVLGIPNVPWRAPDATRLQMLIEQRLMVEVNPRSPVVVVRFEHEDPKFAADFLQHVDDAVDGMLRQRALLRANDYIAYLTAKAPTVTLLEQRIAIAQTLGEQERVKMAASSTRPFVAEVFSGPAASFRPTSPKPYKLLFLSLFFGLAAGVAVVLLRARRRDRAQASV